MNRDCVIQPCCKAFVRSKRVSLQSAIGNKAEIFITFISCKRHAASVAPFIENTRALWVTVLTQCYTHARCLSLISLQSPAQVRGLCNICCGRRPLSVTACWGIQLMLLVFDVKGVCRGRLGGRGSEIKYINPGQRLSFLSSRLPNLFVSAWGH